jgi:hypothetical protein
MYRRSLAPKESFNTDMTSSTIDSVYSTAFGGTSLSMSETTVIPFFNSVQMALNVRRQVVDRRPSCDYESTCTFPQQVAPDSATNPLTASVPTRSDPQYQSLSSGYSTGAWPADTGYMHIVTVTPDEAPTRVFDTSLRAPDIHNTNYSTCVNIVYSFCKYLFVFIVLQSYAATDEHSEKLTEIKRVDCMEISHTSQHNVECRPKNYQGTEGITV